MKFGSGDYRYRAVDGWGEWELGIVTSMATDSKDNVYVIDREPNPAIVVMDRDGKLLNNWGQDFFKVPHSIWISPDDKAYITDCALHTVTVHSLDGAMISMYGTPGEPGAEGEPFNSPTWAVLGNDNDMYVTDGYGQNFVHRFTSDGELMCTWGGTGTAPGKFDIPHCVRIDKTGRVLIIDRTNSRIQIFDQEGNFLEEWTHYGPANDIFIDSNDVCFLAEAEKRISIMTLQGETLAQWGEDGNAPGQIKDAPHGIWVDSTGDIYMCEVPFVPNRLTKYERI